MNCCAIFVNYFGAADVASATRSALDDAPSLEVVVVDNSADDVEFEKLQQLLPRAARLIRSTENIGFGRACNKAFSGSAAEFVFLVNPDVKIMRGCISSMIDELQRDPSLGAVAPRQYLDDACLWKLPPSWHPTVLRAWATEAALRDRRHARRLSHALRAESLRFWTTPNPVSQRALSGGAMLVRRSAIDPLGELFDPRFFMYFEDSDLCHRLRRGGYHLKMVPRALAVHRWRNQLHKGNLMDNGAAVYFSKHGGGENSWLAKSAHLAKVPVLHPLLGEVRKFPERGLVIPGPWEDGWLFELSPSPLLSPAIGRLGAGPNVDFPHDVLANFEGATVYARLGPTVTLGAKDNCWYFEFNVGAQS